MDADRPYVVADDVRIVPVGRLPEPWRDQLADDEDGVAAVRPGARHPVRLLDAEAGYLLRQFAQPRSLRDAVTGYCTATGQDVESVEHDAEHLVNGLLADEILVDPKVAQRRTEPLAAGRCWAGRYRVVELVASLHDRDVHRAVDPDGRLVALKIAAPEKGAGNFGREAELLDHLGGIVSPWLVEQGTSDGRGFLAMEWVAGESLRAASRPLLGRLVDHDDDEAAGQLRQLALALVEAYRTLHAHDVVHGDVHPGNIRTSTPDAVTLIDFDQARRGSGPALDDHRRGVSRYYEPELAVARLGGQPAPAATQASDQHALGVLVYRLLTGQHYQPLAADHDDELRHIAHDPPQPLPPHTLRRWPAVDPVLRRALAKDPAARYPTVADFAIDLAVALPALGP